MPPNPSDVMLPEDAPVLASGGDSPRNPLDLMRAASTSYRCRHIYIPHTMTASALLALVSGLTFYIASAKTTEDLWSRWILTPIAGSIAACAIALLFSQELEKVRIKAGRIITAVLFAVIIPRYLGWQFPSLTTWASDPILLFGVGVVWGLLGYFAGKPIVARLQKDVPKVADKYTSGSLKKINAGKRKGFGHNQGESRRFAQDDDQ